MKKWAFLMALGLGACTSVPPEGVDARMHQWQGYSAEALMDKWGVPAQTNKVEGQDWLIYRDTKTGSKPSIGIGLGGGSGNVFGSLGTVFGGGPSVDGCTRQVVVVDGKVSQIRWQGDPKLCWELTPSPTGSQ
ncbi:MAG: hypothetical protein VX447_12465 [Pseudomonadota bacterium]|uniref:hypothetical protein n=1 Tax=Gallaecimonas pentaromativorans TaxID=584787 RepID=UPI00067F28B1|nr:hypothetical protein [Gallaecimonas pentaromativorans]MED5525549.1 hypothetical protein [Pseudomonadota bacterium]